jgi:hypothetical protein
LGLVLGLLCRRERVALAMFVGLGFRRLLLAEIHKGKVFYLNVLEIAPYAA